MDDGFNIKLNKIKKLLGITPKTPNEHIQSGLVYEEKDIANAKDPLEFLGRSLLLDIEHEMPTHSTEEHPGYKLWVDFCNERAEKTPEPDKYGGFNDRRDLQKIIRLFDKFPKLKENVSGYIELIKELDRDDSHRTVEGSLNMIFLSLNIEPEQANNYAEVVKCLRRLYKTEGENTPIELWEIDTKFENMDPQKFVEEFNRLKPILDKIDLNFKTVSKMTKGKLSVSDEHIQKVASAITDINPQATPLKRQIIHEMLKTEASKDNEKFKHLNKWLHIVDKNIETKKTFLPNTYVLLNKIIFDEDETGGWDPNLDEKCELYEKLLNNEEIIKALKKNEITLTDKGFVVRNKTISEEELIKEENIGHLDFVKMAQYQEQQAQKIADKIAKELPIDIQIEYIIHKHGKSGIQLSLLELLANISKDELYQYFDKVDAIKTKMKQKPELYLNEDTSDKEINNIYIDHFAQTYAKHLYILFNIYDKEAIDTLMRKRLNDFSSYLIALNNLNKDNLALLKDLVNSCNIDGKPFLPTQKIEFIDLIKAYKYNEVPFDKMKEMAKSGRVDLAKLQITLFEELMKNAGMTEEEIAKIPKEKLVAWDKNYTHLLAKAIQESDGTAFSDILRAANLEPDFIKYIHNKNNEYGKANANTQIAFDKMNMNYEKWIKPNKENEIRFISKDKNTEQLKQIASQITEDMNVLMQTPAKGFISKQFPNCIKGDSFFIPKEYLTSKNKLTEFVKILADTSENGQLAQVWKRAQGNIASNDANKIAKAQNTLTVLNHLNQRLDDLSNVQEGAKLTETLDLTIKMWDRNPQKDIFQGNYSTCCIGMGDFNDYAMPHYILNTAYNMIELVDNNSGEIIGNALCYFVKDKSGQPAFIVDNIEIRNSKKPSNEVGIEIRTAIAEYASKIAKDVTGNDKTKIYMGGSYNDVEWEDLNSHKETVTFIGDIDTNKIYMDLYGGTTYKSEFTKDCKLYKLR